MTLAFLVGILGAAPAQPVRAAGSLLMSRSALLALPTSGTAWRAVTEAAASSFGTPNLCDQNEDHHLRTLAAALVYARTGSASYATKARAAILAALPTQKVGCSNAALALGRQLTAYVIAADLVGFGSADGATFRTWLSAIRTKTIGGHSVWTSLKRTHEDSANNWGAYAGAARIAASAYLGDTADLAAASRVTRGFLGDRSAYAGFGHNLGSEDLSWSCTGSPSTYTPVNGACTRSGINVNGVVIADVSRGGSLSWPPGGTGINYQLESIQGLGLQVEILSRHGYAGAWGWSGSALKRMADVVSRSKASGGTGWNETRASRQMPWLLNARYGTKYPTATSGMGRAIGFTDWLYGSGSAPSTTPPAPAPAALPVASTPVVRLARTSTVPSTGIAVQVAWSLKSSSDGVRRYELQMKRGSNSYVTLSLPSPTATSRWVTLSGGVDTWFRVRAVDRAGRVGGWATLGARRVGRIGETSTTVRYAGGWSNVRSTSYLGGAVKSTKSSGATARVTFTGTSIAWIGPVGPTRGKAAVYLDGAYVATVDLRAASYRARQVVFARTVSNGTHVLTIKALGTSGRPTVALDAFHVVRPS